MEFKLINYFDVWGNKKDGYEVNNLCEEKERVTLNEDFNHSELLKELKEIGFFKKHVRLNMLDIYDDGDFIEIFQKKDQKPICRLEFISDNKENIKNHLDHIRKNAPWILS